MNPWITSYLDQQRRAVEALPADAIARAIQMTADAWTRDAQIFVLGNGGSACNASHFVTDLGKSASDAMGRRFRVFGLSDNVAWITAIGNDYAYEDIFVRQLANYARPGDLLIGASVSGDSPNAVKAFAYARENGLHSLALVGAKRGRMATLASHAIAVDDTHYGRVEDTQMHILHLICYWFIENKRVP